MGKFSERPIKKFSIQQIEDVISEAISGLVGMEYKATINHINYGDWLADTFTVEMAVNQKSKDVFGTETQDA